MVFIYNYNMSDNVVLNLGSGGDTVAADDIGGTKYTRGKLTLGAAGVNDGDVSSANPLPIIFACTTFGGQGKVAIGLAAVQLTAQAATRGVIVKSLAGNTGKIYLGNAAGVLTTTGFELSPGDSISLPLTNANLVYAISDTAAQTVCWIGI